MMSDAPTFDRDATKEALPVVAQALMNGGVQGCDEFAAGAAVLDAARWAVKVTEGDGISWCEKHRSRFLEKQPSERSLCLYSLYEDNFIAVWWEDCVPVRARVVIEREQK